MNDHASISTHQIAGRGLVKVLASTGLPERISIGDPIRIDGQDWTVSGIDFGRRNVGIFVRPRIEVGS